MQIEIAPRSHEIERPRYVWLAVAMELLTGTLAIPVGWYTLPDTMVLTWVFLAIGLGLGFVALFWLRRTGQMRLW
jgi:hypothetical protein